MVNQFMTEEPRIQWGKGSLLNQLCWENWTDTGKKMKLDPYFIPHTKIKSKWIEDLNVRPSAIRILEKKHK